MLFPTHLVAAYLLALATRLRPLPVVIGAALPDLIDKPLGMAGVVGSYQTVAHSGLVLLVALAVVLWDRRLLGAAVGWASHLALDAAHMIINGRPVDVLFLLWPIANHEGTLQLPPLEFAVFYWGSPSFFVELGIWTLFLYALRHRILSSYRRLTGAEAER